MKPHWAYIEATDKNELATLERLVQSAKGNIFVDIGCFVGGFTAVMAREAKKRGGKVYSIDIFKNTHEPLDFWKEHLDYNVRNIFEDNMKEIGVMDCIEVIEGLSWEASARFESESVDFIFVDADHHYSSVVKDLLNWTPKLKPGGIICGHDYNLNAPIIEQRDVQRAVDELFNNVKVENRIWSI